MSYRAHIFIRVTCDMCDRVLDCDDFDWWWSVGDAEEEATAQSWRTLPEYVPGTPLETTRHYCPECWEQAEHEHNEQETRE